MSLSNLRALVMDRRAWCAAVRGVTKSWTLSNWTELKYVQLFLCYIYFNTDFPGGSDGKRNCLQCMRSRLSPWVRKIPWRRKWQPIPVFLTGEFHGQRNLAGYSPWGCKELDMTEQLTLHFRDYIFFKLSLSFKTLEIIRWIWFCLA